MNEERDKFLTEVMGGCWHIREGDEYYTDAGTPYHICKCGKKLVFHETSRIYNYDFSTWSGFGVLWNWAQKQDWWNDFKFWASKQEATLTLEQFVQPDRFADAVYEFLRGDK